MKEVNERVDYLLTLKDDWDSYGAYPCTQKAADAVKKFFDSIFISLTNDGGISIETNSPEVGILMMDITSEGVIGDTYIGGPHKSNPYENPEWFIEWNDDHIVQFIKGLTGVGVIKN